MLEAIEARAKLVFSISSVLPRVRPLTTDYSLLNTRVMAAMDCAFLIDTIGLDDVDDKIRYGDWSVQ